MKVPFLDLVAHHAPHREEILAAWARLYDQARFVSGAEVAAFEEEYAAAHDVASCVAVSTGTDALVLILSALGITAGDAVAVPANTFIATAEAVSHAGASVLLVDCDETAGSIDLGRVEELAARNRLSAVMAVHLYGFPVDVPALRDRIPRETLVIEDAAQAHLAKTGGRRVGGLGTAAGFSFYPGKNLGALGEGGAVTTNDLDLAERIRRLRDHGQSSKYHHDFVGFNARMHEMVAAALRIKLKHLPRWTAQRRQIAGWYRERLAGDPRISLPPEKEGTMEVYHLFVVHVPGRDRVMEVLEESGIGVGLHYPTPIHLQKAYAHLGKGVGSYPVSERKAGSLLSLPMFPELTESQVDYVCDRLTKAVGGK